MGTEVRRVGAPPLDFTAIHEGHRAIEKNVLIELESTSKWRSAGATHSKGRENCSAGPAIYAAAPATTSAPPDKGSSRHLSE
jgi:hypothetical protein